MQSIQKIQNTLSILGVLRLIVFTFIIFFGYEIYQKKLDFYDQNLIYLFLSLGSFVVCYLNYKKYTFEEKILKAYLFIEKNEKSHLFLGDDKLYHQNIPFVKDLQIFGKQSLFQAIDRTETIFGSEKLINMLVFGAKNILQSQEIIKEIKEKENFRYRLQAFLSFTEVKDNFNKNLISFFENTSKINRFFLFYPYFSLIFFVFSAFYIHFFENNWMIHLLLYFFAINAFIFFIYLKKIQKELILGEKIVDILKYYLKVIDLIQTTDFEHAFLIHLKENITNKQIIFKEFLRLMGSLQSVYNLFGATILNALGLFSLKTYTQLQILKLKNAEDITRFFNDIGTFEAYNSLGNFYAHHPYFRFPKIEKKEKIEAVNMKHPFILNAKGSNFYLKKGQIVLLTGANMSGKSTFLKTLGLNILLAKMGLPVAVENFSTYPFDLQTFMQNTDDLQKQTSYFLAEILQLKDILTKIDAGEPIFILLDEILKGTNSKDKLAGSIAFVEKLLSKNTTGILATHDLALTNLAEKYPDKILNFHFAGKIVEEDVKFDYLLKEGICEDTNALFLMEKWGVI